MLKTFIMFFKLKTFHEQKNQIKTKHYQTHPVKFNIQQFLLTKHSRIVYTKETTVIPRVKEAKNQIWI